MKILNLFFERKSFAVDYFKEYVSHNETNFETCEFVISSGVDFGETNRKIIQNKLNEYKNYSKKVVFFLNSDFANKLTVPANVLLFRTSMYKSIQKSNEYLLPYIWENPTITFQPLPKSEFPIVGFCGNTKNNLGYRQSCINRLKNDSKIVTKIIPRIGFWGGKPNNKNYINDFENNIKESHFSLCNRGKGNFSIRFFQVLAMGRIPILIDSDMVFPFENEIEWDNFIIKSKSENDLIKKLNYFWNSKSDKEIEDIQLKCKQLHTDFFEPKSFGNKIAELLYAEKVNLKIEKQKALHLIKFPEIKYKINKKINLILSKLK